MATQYFRKRTSITNAPVMTVTNLGKNNWNVNAGPQRTAKPNNLITTDGQMGYAVQSMTYNHAVHIAPTRHGAIYDVRVNNDVRARIQHLRNVLRSDPNTDAYVDGSVPFTSGHVLISVAHIPETKRMAWNDWLRYRVREAKMHRALYARVAASHRASNCSPVPLLYFAGVDHDTGLYYVVMQRPPGTLHSIATIESKNALTMPMYRAIEAAIGSLWFAGGMLSDTSAGNILITSRNHVVIPDFDSALVIPPGLKDRLRAQLSAFYAMPRKFGPCRTVRNSKEFELVTLWDFVMRESSNRPSLQRLAINVFGRRRWFPDIELLRSLRISERAEAMTPSGLRRILGGSGGSGLRDGLRGGLRGLLGGRTRENGNGGSAFLNVRLRKIGALSEEDKKVWRRRQRRPKEPRERRSRKSSTPTTPVAATLPAPNRPSARNNNNNNNRVPMPSRRNNNANNNNNNNSNPKISNELANLVKRNPTLFQGGMNLGTTPAKNNNATKKFASNRADFAKYTTLDIDHQAHLMDVEVERFRATRAFREFVKKLAGGASFDGSPALNSAIQKENPVMGWKGMGNASKRDQRREMHKKIAESMLRDSLQYVLVKNLPSADDRDELLKKALDKSAVAMGWGNWAASLKKRVWG
jgi:hypothetical protein